MGKTVPMDKRLLAITAAGLPGVSVASLCAELGIRVIIARDRLRTSSAPTEAIPCPRQIAQATTTRSEEWPKGSAAVRKARTVLTRQASKEA